MLMLKPNGTDLAFVSSLIEDKKLSPVIDSTYTLDEIGKKFNLTRERIRQIEKAALGKLANSNIKEHLESFLKNQ